MKNEHDYTYNINIIDCHEHLYMPELRVEESVSLLNLLHYIKSDLLCSGINGDITLKSLFDGYKNIYSTAYGKMLRIIAEDLFDIQLNSLKDFIALDNKIREKSINVETTTKWYDEVYSKTNIQYSLSVYDGTKRNYKPIKPIMYLDFLLKKDTFIHHKINGSNTLQEYINYVDDCIAKYVQKGMVAGKFAISYWHSLDFVDLDIHLAKEQFENLNGESEYLESYIFFHILSRFQDLNLPIQFHTGHVEPSAISNKYKMNWSNPEAIYKYTKIYPRLKFILLHGGFPYQDIYLSIAKNSKNVYVDLSWIYIISPTIAKTMLKKALETIPNNKIIGFGGDVMHVEAMYAHLIMCKNVINQAMHELIDSNWIDHKGAADIVEKILYNNPKKIYRL